jgi:hypothetical protein
MLRDEADRWDVEITFSLVDCDGCGTAAGCSGSHAEAAYHEDFCECVFQDVTDENRDADWRCACFDTALAFARGINTTWESM